MPWAEAPPSEDVDEYLDAPVYAPGGNEVPLASELSRDTDLSLRHSSVREDRMSSFSASEASSTLL